MANPVCEVLLTKAQLKVPQENIDLAVGAVVDFWGIVRDAEDGGEIDGIEYEAHQTLAEHQLNRIAQQAIEKFELALIVIHHRIGFFDKAKAWFFLRVGGDIRGNVFGVGWW